MPMPKVVFALTGNPTTILNHDWPLLRASMRLIQVRNASKETNVIGCNRQKKSRGAPTVSEMCRQGDSVHVAITPWSFP